MELKYQTLYFQKCRLYTSLLWHCCKTIITVCKNSKHRYSFVKEKGVLNRLFCLCFKMSCVTSDESQDLWGMEKLFRSSWKEIAGEALRLLSIPSHRESHGSGWKEWMGERPPGAACCWLIPDWAGSLGKSAEGHCWKSLQSADERR